MELPSGSFSDRFLDSFLVLSLAVVKTGIGVDDIASWSMSGDMPLDFFFIPEKFAQNLKHLSKNVVILHCKSRVRQSPKILVFLQIIGFFAGYFKQISKNIE
jgi:hypothetical protein